MMSVNQWLMLWLIFISYLFLGAFIFYAIERRYEEYRRVDDNPEKLEIEDLLNTYYTWTNNRAHKQLLLRLRQHCNVTVLKPVQYSNDIIEVEDEFQWTFYNSFFFALTTLSTIGYGNLHPTSCLGRMLVIVYSLVGIPLNGIVLTQLGEFFASTFLRVHQRYKGRRFETRFVLLVDIATYLIPGILLFIFLPSGFFVYFEGWTFEQSIYFAYVTLTTIGYGDFVAGQSTTDVLWYNVYKVVLIFWIMFGLGYLVMILGFISRAMRCKKVAHLERKLAQNLKQTHSKILNEFSRDVSYVRRLLNELYLLKFKPVYQDERDSQIPAERRRSQSAPNLTEWPVLEKIPQKIEYSSSEDEEETRMQFEKQRMTRRKALSENLFKHSALRMHSETDLTKIDRNATFNNAAYVERSELMARMTDAFKTTYNRMQLPRASDSTTETDDEEPGKRKVSKFERELHGIDGFTKDEILSNEWYVFDKGSTNAQQLTWPGSESTIEKTPYLSSADVRRFQQAADTEKRRSPLPGMQSLRRMSIAALNFLAPTKFNKPVANDDFKDAELGKPKERRDRRTGKIACPRKKRYSLCDEYQDMCEYVNYFTQIRMKEANLFSSLKNHIGNLDESSPVLEQTSIGDFLRVVNSLSATATMCDSDEPTKGESPLFTLFQNETGKPESTRRRFSLIPARSFSCEPKTESRTRFDMRRGSAVPRHMSFHDEKPITDCGKGRRFSLAPPKTSSLDVTNRHRSFSTHMRRLSPSRYTNKERPERTSPNQTRTMSQVRRMRSELIPSVVPEVSSTGPPSQKIKRFLVKPVALPLSTPEIIVSAPSSNQSTEASHEDHDYPESHRL